MTPPMTAFDLYVLREIATPGSQPDLRWGAAMSEALGYLRGRQYITGYNPTVLTAKGRRYLESHREVDHDT